MKIATCLLASITVMATVQMASAAPQVSGKYAVMVTTLCQARIVGVLKEFVTELVPSSGDTGGGVHDHAANDLTLLAVSDLSHTMSSTGEINISVGTLTFPAAPASSGSATLEATVVAGASVKLQTGGTITGSAIKVKSESLAGSFAVTNTSFRFGTMTWHMRPARIVNGVARKMFMVRKENERCVNSMTATKQRSE